MDLHATSAERGDCAGDQRSRRLPVDGHSRQRRERPVVNGDLARLCNRHPGGQQLGINPDGIEHDEPLNRPHRPFPDCEGDHAYGHPWHRDHRQQVPELASHHFGVAYLVTQDRLLDDDIELAVLVVQDAGAFQAGIGCSRTVIGDSPEGDDRGQQRRRVGRCLEQARYHVGLIEAEPDRPLIQRDEGFLEMPQASDFQPPPFGVHRVGCT